MKPKSIFITTLLMILSTSVLAKDYFTTKRDRLIDAGGKTFVIKGVNNPHAWFGNRAYDALDYIADINSNCVRIVWQTRGSVQELERIIKRCIELEMIPMVELHDVTGNPSKERLVDMAEYYAREDVSSMLKLYEKYLLINIANEWGDHAVTTEHWLDSYTEAVKVLRDAGYKTTIVVDSPGWGQNINPILEAGKELIENDEEHNILFSVHMYGSWNDPEKIKTDLNRAKRLKLPLIVGEFGYNSRNGDNNLGCKADHTVILSTCTELGYGYMPWSWTGNNAENAWLDMVNSSDWKTLTWWGKEVVDTPMGIRATAKKASVFK